jgi:thymidylate kinase
VIYDRHFFFDTAPGIMDSQGKDLRGLDRIYSWLMSHWYPRPSLTIFLDAPPDLLYQRKGEATPEYLERQRRVYLEQGEKIARFIRVDASQPLDKVIDEVNQLIQEHNTSQGHHHSVLPVKEGIKPNEP